MYEISLLKRASKVPSLLSFPKILNQVSVGQQVTLGSMFLLTFQFNSSVVCIRSVSLYIYLLVILVNIHEDFFA